MHKSLFLLPLLALVACQTPREACISQASENLRTVNSLIAETEANISRGFGLVDRQEVRIRQDICVIENEDGTQSQFICEKQDIVTVQDPVGLDIAAEQAKLASLREQQARLQGQQAATIQACTAAYPDE
jgi:hypothetical protein